MPILNSTIVNTLPSNPTNPYPVIERHTDHNGKSYDVTYLAEVGVDTDAVLLARAAKLGAEIDSREEAELIASNFSIPLTKYQFRQRFTQEERMACDAFNISFESHPLLTDDQKAFIRTGLEDFKVAEAVDPPKAMPLLQMYEALGLIGSDRAAEIGAV